MVDDSIVRLLANLVSVDVNVEDGAPSGTDRTEFGATDPASEQPENKVEIVDWTWAYESGYGNTAVYAVSGKMKNLTDRTLNSVDFEVLLYDKNGKICAGSSIVYAENVPAYGTAAIKGHAMANSGRPCKASIRVSSIH